MDASFWYIYGFFTGIGKSSSQCLTQRLKNPNSMKSATKKTSDRAPETAPRAALSGRLERLERLGAEALEVIGRFDHVTQLPNRLQFIREFSTTFMAGAGEAGLGLILVTLADAKHFNEILRALGHAFAEEFVRQGSRKIESLLPAGHPLYHVSVLSFAFPHEIKLEDERPEIVGRVLHAFSAPVLSNNVPVETRIGIGVAGVGELAADPSEVLRAVLTAAQDSRRTETGWATYNRKSDAAHQRAFRILTDLPAAIAARDQLSLHFQPRLDLASGRCIGAEALLRWTHPELGFVLPGEFIPLVEQTALIAPLTDWVMRSAISQTGEWSRSGKDISVSLNASPNNLSQAGFDEKLIGLCDTFDLDPSRIELEFTESTLSSNAARTRQNLESIRRAGVEVALDDFGSGFSNLSYLTQIPADILKIDQSFVRPLGTPKGSLFLVRQIVNLAKGLGFRVVAEGIETAEAYELLKHMGCDEGQGYFMSKPLPAPAFEQWYAARPA